MIRDLIALLCVRNNNIVPLIHREVTLGIVIIFRFGCFPGQKGRLVSPGLLLNRIDD